MRWKAVKDFLRIALICCMWYAVSTANGVIGKRHLVSYCNLTAPEIVVYNR